MSSEDPYTWWSGKQYRPRTTPLSDADDPSERPVYGSPGGRKCFSKAPRGGVLCSLDPDHRGDCWNIQVGSWEGGRPPTRGKK